MLPKLKVLFLCTKNSCRSQMAEGWARFLHASRIDTFSAGISAGTVDPNAVEAMREAGVDISGQHAKSVATLRELDFDWAITLCDAANEACPAFPPPARRLHFAFDDPPRLAANATGERALAHYRRVRDQIRAFVQDLPARLAVGTPEPALARDLPAVLELVRAAGLPTEGIEDAFPQGYSVLRRGPEIVAVAGLEPHGREGLLRSVAVGPGLRGTGIGRRLVEERIDFARRQKLDAVYLLTTTAAGFFRRLGFEEAARATAPAQLLESSEFKSVCPSSAVCLRKRVSE